MGSFHIDVMKAVNKELEEVFRANWQDHKQLVEKAKEIAFSIVSGYSGPGPEYAELDKETLSNRICHLDNVRFRYENMLRNQLVKNKLLTKEVSDGP